MNKTIKLWKDMKKRIIEEELKTINKLYNGKKEHYG